MSDEPFDLETDIDMTPSTIWTLEEGLAFARNLERLLVPAGFHCALGGSVLHSGSSQKDLDIFIYPHKSNGEPVSDADVLSAIFEVLPNGWKVADHSAYGDEKRVFYAYPNRKRVDFFLLA